MIRIDARYGTARKLLLAATLGFGVLTAFSHPGRAFASLSTTEQSQPAAAAPGPQAPPSASVVQAPPPSQQQQMQQRRAAAQHQAMPRRAMAGQGFNDPERTARRRAFVGGVLIGIVAASRLRR